MYKSWLYITDVLENLEYDILGISETGLEDSDEIPEIPGFSFSYNDKFRLIVYHRTKLDLKETKIFARCPVVFLDGYHTSFAFIYGEHTKFSWGKSIEISVRERAEIISNAISLINSKSKKNLIIQGDLNLRYEQVNENSAILQFVLNYEELGLVNLVNDFTRFSVGEQLESKSKIDYCLVRNVEGSCNLLNFPRSDHKLVKFSLPAIKFERRKKCTINIFKKDIRILQELEEEAPDVKYSYSQLDDKNVTELDQIITNHLSKVNNVCRKEVVIFTNGLPWVNSKLVDLKIKACRGSGKLRKLRLKEYEKAFKQEYRSYIRRQKEKKGHCFPRKVKKKIEMLEHNGRKVTDEKELCEIMKNTFQTRSLNFQKNSKENYGEVIDELKFYYENLESVTRYKRRDNWTFKVPSSDYLKKTILAFSEQFTPDFYGISYTLLKFALPHILTSLQVLMKKSILNGELPDAWLTAILVCVPKPGKNAKSNLSFRPIAIISILLKVLMKLVSTSLMETLNSFGLFDDPRLYGFLPGRSSSQAIEDLIRQLANMRQKFDFTSICTSDLRGAFDSVLGIFLYDLLATLKPNEKVLKLMKSYLQPREIRVRIGKTTSSPYLLSRGLLQGCYMSVLGFLFIMSRLNKFNRGSTCLQYCDDVLFVLADNGPREHIRSIKNTMENFENYISSVGMEVEAEKSFRVTRTKIGTKLPKCLEKFNLFGHSVTNSTSLKYLGVPIQANYQFSEYAEQIYKKLKQKGGWLKKNCVYLPNNIRREFFMAQVLGITNYAMYEISPFLTQQNLDLISRGFNYCLRGMLFLRKKQKVCVSEIRNKFQIPSIHQIYRDMLELRAFKNRKKYFDIENESNRPVTRAKSDGFIIKSQSQTEKQYTYEFHEARIFREHRLQRFISEKDLRKFQKSRILREFKNNIHFKLKYKYGDGYYPYSTCRLRD